MTEQQPESAKRLLMIINPISGTLSKAGLEQRVRQRLEPAGFTIDIVETQYGGHAKELTAKAVAEGYYGVLAAGGDGTVNEIASSLRSSSTALGILPLGSGNGLARHLFTNIDIDHALDIIAKDAPTQCDYATANGYPFFCTFGLGFDAKVTQEYSQMSRRGLISYIKSALQEYFNFTPLTYSITTTNDSITVKAFLIAVCNASQYGNNAYIAPEASIHDGLLDIVIISPGNPITRAIAGVELFTGRINQNLLIQTLRVRSAQIKHLPGPGHVDGEPLTLPETIDVICHPGDIRIFTDPDKTNFKPIITPIESLRDDSSYLIKEGVKNTIRSLRNTFKP